MRAALLAAAGLAALSLAGAAAQQARPRPAPGHTPQAGPQAAPHQPDPQAARSIVENGTEAGAAPCSQCHGADGTANGNDAFPRLDGQSAYYIYKQLDDYASGARQNEIMTGIAQALTPGQRQDLAAYYAEQPFHALDMPAADDTQVGVGARIYEVGIRDRGVQACANCHGPMGSGIPPITPRLAGQWASYVEAQFAAFHGGSRKNDVSAVMREVSAKMSEDQVKAVALYLQSAQPAR
jgi:cytochrome c553